MNICRHDLQCLTSQVNSGQTLFFVDSKMEGLGAVKQLLFLANDVVLSNAGNQKVFTSEKCLNEEQFPPPENDQKSKAGTG